MRNFEIAKMNMYGKLNADLKENESKWQPIAHINDSVIAFRACFALLQSFAVTRDGRIKEFASRKQRRKADLEKTTLFVALQIKAYALITDNDSLFTDMYYTKTSLKRSTGKALVFDSGKIHEVATAHAVALASLGVTQAVRDDLAAKRTAFSDYLNVPAEKHKLDKEKTANFRKTMKEMGTLLRYRLDIHMRYFEDVDYDYFIQYFKMRGVDDLPTIKLAMRCKIVDSGTKEPLRPLVKIQDHKIDRKASPKGQLLVRNLKEGDHTVAVSLDGYIAQSPTVHYTKGKTTFVTIEMVKME